jgi:chaperonin cofactor prefoldin
MTKMSNEKEALKVEVSQEDLEAGKKKVEDAKTLILKNIKNKKEVKVTIHGISEVEAQAVNTVLHHIEGTKTQPNQHLQSITKQLETIETDLDLFGGIEKELNSYNNQTKVYRKVTERIESIKKYREYLEAQVKPIKETIEYADETIAKIKYHIVETEKSDGIHVLYDEVYLRPMLDLAYVIFDLVRTEDGGVELKSKVKE